MCLEDLRLGRGREVGKYTLVSANDTPDKPSLPANPNRVAIMIASGTVTGGSNICLCRDSIGNNPIIHVNDQFSPFTIVRIEDCGQAITQTLWAIGTIAGGSTFGITEIISQVNAPPIQSYIK